MRVVFVGNMDFFPDANVDETLLFAYEGVSPWETAVEQPPVLTWFNSIFVRLFGFSEFSMRFSSVLFGTFTVILVYYLVKLWYGPKHALISALLLAVIPLHVVYSRVVFREAIQTFFLLSAIFVMELIVNKKIKKNKTRYIWLSFSGILFALSFLSKYNAIIVWGIYNLFLIGYSLFNKRGLKSRIWRLLRDLTIVNLSAVIFFILTIIIPGGISRLIHVTYSIFDWVFKINVRIVTTSNHYFLIMFNILSPLLYLTFIISLVYLIIIILKKRIRADILLISLFFIYFILINQQHVKYSKYLMMVVPFVPIIISRLIMRVYKINKKLFLFIILILFSTTIGWTINEISSYNDYNLWSEVGEYINNNFPEDTTVYVSPHFYHLSLNYIDREINFSKGSLVFEKGDLVLLSWFSPEEIIRGGGPLDQNPFAIQTSLPAEYKDVEEYNSHIYPIIKNDKLVNVFGDGKVNSTRIYEITEPKTINVSLNDEGIDHFGRHPGAWDNICYYLNYQSFLKEFTFGFLSDRQIRVIQKRCG